jgi:pimeloyl-ACP methyl ester carboxylesterase
MGGTIVKVQDMVQAAINGLVGDVLASRSHALAIPLQLRMRGRTLEIDSTALAAAIPDASSRVVVLAHGLCCSDQLWGRANGHDHGMALGRDLGYTPLYLHYNSGRHISTNGREFAALLERLIEAWPVAVDDIALIGHSMGGLVARSACFYGKAARHAWVGRLRHMVFLGTPHHGVLLARAGMLGSAGIADLRHGYLVDEDWQGRDRFDDAGGHQRHIALPRGVNCYAIAGTIGASRSGWRDSLLGDGLVPLDTALGRHREEARTLGFAGTRTWVAPGVHHFDLLSHPGVYARIRAWLA